MTKPVNTTDQAPMTDERARALFAKLCREHRIFGTPASIAKDQKELDDLQRYVESRLRANVQRSDTAEVPAVDDAMVERAYAAWVETGRQFVLVRASVEAGRRRDETCMRAALTAALSRPAAEVKS